MADTINPDSVAKEISPVAQNIENASTTDAKEPTSPRTDAPAGAAPESSSSKESEGPQAVQKTNGGLAERMARFKALQAQKDSSREANKKAARIEEQNRLRDPDAIKKLEHAHDMAEYKLLKNDDPDFERKRAWDYTAEEDETWSKRVKKRQGNASNNSFQDYRREANKIYKRQIKQMSKVDLEAYAASRAEKLQKQVSSGLLELVETDDGDVFTVDKQGRVNTPVEENYNCDHKPSKEAVDRLVDDLEKGERARLKARAARGMKEDDGDVTYINQKNKQFNDKLARFYNKYTSEIRESFERGTAI